MVDHIQWDASCRDEYQPASVLGLLMRTIWALLLLLLGATNVTAWPVHGQVPPSVVCPITTGNCAGIGGGSSLFTAAKCDGTTDDNAAFNSFASWAVNTWQASHAGQIELYVPPGVNCVWNQAFALTFSGIRNLLVVGYGATWSGSYIHLATFGQYQDRVHSVRLLTATAGANTITVNPASLTQPNDGCQTVAACAALFTVGQIALISGFDLQHGGFPGNWHYFEYVVPTAINASSGVVTLSAPLKYTYKATWPSYNVNPVPPGGQPDFGGPATLFAWNPTWPSSFEYRGLTFASTAGVQNDITSQFATFRDVTFNQGAFCAFPSMNQTFQVINSTMTACQIEADKLIGDVNFTNTTLASIGFQSSSIERFTASSLTVASIAGTPKKATISNSTISVSFSVGASVNGRTDSISLTNTSVASLAQSGISVGGILYQGNGLNGSGVGEGLNNAVGWSMSAAGVITIPNAYIVQAGGNISVGWMVPGTNLCWNDTSYTCGALFQITDVTQDANPSSIITISHASPAVIGSTAHGRTAGDLVGFMTSGACALPAPLTCLGTGGLGAYYVKTVIDANNYTVSLTNGGAAINTTTDGTGPFGVIQGNTYVATNAPSCAFACWSYAGGKLFVRTHPAPIFNCSGCSGDPAIAGLNTAPANAPLYSYFKRTMTNATNATSGLSTVWGTLTNLKVTIANGNQYTGSLTATNNPNVEHPGNWLNSSFVAGSYIPAVINEKSAGTRTLSGGAWTGAQSGDTLTNPSSPPLWAPEYWQNAGTDISSDPSHPMSMDVEVVTTQGVVNPP